MAKRRAKAQRPLLLKFLQEIGYDDIFNVDEVNEIKALYDKAQEEMKENLEAEKAGEAASMSYTDKLEEKMLANAKDDAPVHDKNEPEVIDGQSKDAKGVNVKPKFDIRAHFDSVRDMIYVNQLNIVASVADDSQVKLWNLKNIQKQFDSDKGQLESFATLRGHKGALTSITGPSLQTADVPRNVSKLIFTAGHEGTIRAWNIPEFRGSEEKYPQTNGQNFCVGIFDDAVK